MTREENEWNLFLRNYSYDWTQTVHWIVPYKVDIFLCGLDIQDGHHCKT